ncbi:MAG TPA: hypothetical protein VLR26_18625 [Frankiaceae bacterium]|nr:hypothetical protein [Frankiaceae bacterium]
MNPNFLRVAWWAWAGEVAVAGFNYFVLMKRVYEPRVGELRAHQIGMATRIVCIFGAAAFLVAFEPDHSALDLVYAGVLWLSLALVFEWGGSLLMRRPVHEILVGWHVNRGYMWPFVLATYLVAPVVMGFLNGL